MPGDTPRGYDDTPYLPGSEWRVHDIRRPQPPVVAPGPPPSDAVVLFDGVDLAAWRSTGGGPVGWRVADGYAEVVPSAGDIETVEHFGDCQLHVEWAAPAEVSGSSQGRGNSGVILMGRYEVQVLDSHGNPTYADGAAAAVYGQHPPLVNASRPPGEWQAFDVVFHAPRFDGGAVARPAVMTVFHNGVLVHHARELLGATAHRAVGRYEPHPPTGPVRLQDHGDLVRYRNVWVRRLAG